MVRKRRFEPLRYCHRQPLKLVGATLHNHAKRSSLANSQGLRTERLSREQRCDFPVVQADFDPAVALTSELTLHRFPTPCDLRGIDRVLAHHSEKDLRTLLEAHVYHATTESGLNAFLNLVQRAFDNEEISESQPCSTDSLDIRGRETRNCCWERRARIVDELVKPAGKRLVGSAEAPGGVSTLPQDIGDSFDLCLTVLGDGTVVALKVSSRKRARGHRFHHIQCDRLWILVQHRGHGFARTRV